MEPPGIVGTLQLAAVLVLALPAALFGVERLLRGQPDGLAFVALGALMLGLQQYLTDPLDPGDVAEAAVERVRRRD